MLDFSLILQFFVLLNPMSSLSVLISAYKQKMDVRKLAINAVMAAFAIALCMVFVGPYLFSLFGITLNSFKIAGGVVLFLLGLDTIRPKQSTEGEFGQVEALISIIATPLLTGPATISFITLKTFEIGALAVLSNLIVAFMGVFLVFYTFSMMINKVNFKLVGIASRILGLFLTAVAIEMIANGISALFFVH
ncbi:MarC family protein [Candidatus Micrarchaeota archaeon]|nr:MarC family protein [Candidatus Micrarchaeota archaeon]